MTKLPPSYTVLWANNWNDIWAKSKRMQAIRMLLQLVNMQKKKNEMIDRNKRHL